MALNHIGGPAHKVAPQEAFARAARLDRSFEHEEPALLADTQVYDAGLDLGRAIPPDFGVGTDARVSFSHWPVLRPRGRDPPGI